MFLIRIGMGINYYCAKIQDTGTVNAAEGHRAQAGITRKEAPPHPKAYC
jgi:hypothetical protein